MVILSAWALIYVLAADNEPALGVYKDLQYLNDIVGFIQRHEKEKERNSVLVGANELTGGDQINVSPFDSPDEIEEVAIGVSPFEDELETSSVDPTPAPSVEKQDIHVDAGVHFNVKKGSENDCEEPEEEECCEEEEKKKKKFWFLSFSSDEKPQKVHVPSRILVEKAFNHSHNLFKNEGENFHGDLLGEKLKIKRNTSISFNRTSINRSNDSLAYSRATPSSERKLHFVYEEDSSGSRLQIMMLSVVVGLAIVLHL